MLIAWNTFFASVVIVLDHKHMIEPYRNETQVLQELIRMWFFLTACCTPIQFIMLVSYGECNKLYRIAAIVTYWIVSIVFLLFTVPIVAFGSAMLLRLFLYHIPFGNCVEYLKMQRALQNYWGISKHSKKTWKLFKEAYKDKYRPYSELAEYIIEYHSWLITLPEAEMLNSAGFVCEICDKTFARRDSVYLDPERFFKFHADCILKHVDHLEPKYWIRLSKTFYENHQDSQSPPILVRYHSEAGLLSPVIPPEPIKPLTDEAAVPDPAAPAGDPIEPQVEVAQ